MYTTLIYKIFYAGANVFLLIQLCIINFETFHLPQITGDVSGGIRFLFCCDVKWEKEQEEQEAEWGHFCMDATKNAGGCVYPGGVNLTPRGGF